MNQLKKSKFFLPIQTVKIAISAARIDFKTISLYFGELHKNYRAKHDGNRVESLVTNSKIIYSYK